MFSFNASLYTRKRSYINFSFNSLLIFRKYQHLINEISLPFNGSRWGNRRIDLSKSFAPDRKKLKRFQSGEETDLKWDERRRNLALLKMSVTSANPSLNVLELLVCFWILFGHWPVSRDVTQYCSNSIFSPLTVAWKNKFGKRRYPHFLKFFFINRSVRKVLWV